MNPIWQTARFQLDLATPKIMGILNITPDSFSDGGTYSSSLKSTLQHAEQLLADGADILDIGGESTRPNAAPVSPETEWQRVQPVLAEIAKWNVPISLDTRRVAVMRLALAYGFADIINDVQGLEDEGSVALLAQSSAGVCVMHMKGLPENMQNNPNYQDVVREVADYLQQRADVCIQAGIAPERIVLDAGFGFGKTLSHNIALMQHLGELGSSHNLPHLVGVSRKRMIGEITGRENPMERVSGSVAAALFAIEKGAKIVRVHDVRETVDALKVWQALRG
ncbi:dihydropteroate synthase [Kingella negevensis]|uniref:Dihydropteroate synthase n=1 Tax=Kingella negevensis TaxID=1522312 RepID=A0A238HFR8_9NEIS|nr:dihydropteroate synthase [Kingella negevensis]MDK4683644.1 dihydropteroate synthase [Kingella negevensis]MDK4697678.1 dihydropteroate synthase [Kingella negevensis]MDK4708461.1 dihydropteroate synthase [Kingella negevensis]MDK4710878.1 dihydropteroate synthase [Kingella negevensis]SNB67607.1 Dihydropteroate synthase [Kingella negevensis]